MKVCPRHLHRRHEPRLRRRHQQVGHRAGAALPAGESLPPPEIRPLGLPPEGSLPFWERALCVVLSCVLPASSSTAEHKAGRRAGGPPLRAGAVAQEDRDGDEHGDAARLQRVPHPLPPHQPRWVPPGGSAPWACRVAFRVVARFVCFRVAELCPAMLMGAPAICGREHLRKRQGE